MNETDPYQSDESRSSQRLRSQSSISENYTSKKNLMDQMKILLLNSLPHIAILILFLLYSLIGAAIFAEIEKDNLVASSSSFYASKGRTLVANPKEQEYRKYLNRLFSDHTIKMSSTMNKLIANAETSIPAEGLEFIEKLNLKNSYMKQSATNKLGDLLTKSNIEFKKSIKSALEEFENEQKILAKKLCDLLSNPDALLDDSASTCTKDTCQENKSFLTSLHFVVASLLTIGYRGTMPETIFGKLFIITYLIIGLPLTLIFLSDIGKLITRFLNFLSTMYIILCLDIYYDPILKFLDKHNWRISSLTYRTFFSKMKRPKPQAHNQEYVERYETLARTYLAQKSVDLNNNNSTTIEQAERKRDMLQVIQEIFFKSLQHSDNTFNFSFSFLTFLTVAYLTVGAFTTAHMNNQSILDGYYFSILTLTRIDSGDVYIHSSVQAFILFLYVLLGMSFFSLVITYLQEQIRRILLKNGQTIVSEVTKFINQFGYQLKKEDFNLTLSAETARFTADDKNRTDRSKLPLQRLVTKSETSSKPSKALEIVRCDKQTQITTLLYSRLKYEQHNPADMPHPTKKANMEFCSTPTLTKQLLIK